MLNAEAEGPLGTCALTQTLGASIPVFFNKRRRYNGTVATLLPAFGFTLDDAGTMKTLNVLDTAWQQNYNANEAALFVAYLYFHGALTSGMTEAPETLRRIRFVQDDWLRKGVIRNELVSRFSAKADEWLSVHASTTETPAPSTTTNHLFVASLPNSKSNTPLRVEHLDGLDVLYYENPTTIGASMGLPEVFVCPQVAVVSRGNLPIVIVRLEQSPFGTSMLATLDANGHHANYGTANVVPSLEFIKRAAALARKSA